MTIFKKIIIWFFEKYAFDYWIEIENEKEIKRLMNKYGVDRDEVDDLLADLAQQEKNNYCSGNSFF